MIFIVVKFEVKDEYAERWPEIVADFTAATRQEPGNKWFDWSRSLDNPNEYVLVEAFEDDAAEAMPEMSATEAVPVKLSRSAMQTRTEAA